MKRRAVWGPVYGEWARSPRSRKPHWEYVEEDDEEAVRDDRRDRRSGKENSPSKRARLT
ncbi:hypothetical protein CVT24_012868 [Panaeolus cyanescens]|uniref:Uncharacterized protein n=1 Tax=Panaeolus cyanescens TaxID=181874 RepID=A0A409X4I7_9AGAR|nr:hypothetical protein CVT24_012868 [Panaeolus cyanescens]